MSSEHSQRLAALDRRYVWHPFTQMREWVESDPLVIVGGQGCYLIDSEGRRYLDGVSSLWVLVHGHGRREIVEAIQRQAARLAHSTLLGLANAPSAELAQRLVQVAPEGLERVFYSDSGSTAVEIALKMAFQYWKHRGRPSKERFVCLREAYHGDTLGAVSVGGIDLFHGIFGPLLFETLQVPTPARSDDALAKLEQVLVERGDEVAAFVLEPLVQGAAGMLVHPPGYLRAAAELCRRHEVLLVADEVATGFGRTGTMFACEQEGVSPDLLCVAKGITGGTLPLAATLATDEIYRAFLAPRQELKQFFHGHTYTGNPVACAAALASLALFESDRTLENVRARAEEMRRLLAEQVEGLPAVAEVRQRGLMVGIELAVEGGGARACQAAREHGVVIRPLGDVVVLMPPLSISESELAELVGATAAAIRETVG